MTDCRRVNQGNKSHKDVESILIPFLQVHHAIKVKPFPNGMQAVGLIGHDDNSTAKDCDIDVSSATPLGATNQELKNRNALGHQPAPSEQDPRNATLVSAAWAEAHKHIK